VDPVCQMRVGAKRAPARLPFEGGTYLFCSLACARAFAEHPDRYATQ
ncbi:MAG: YHS domain-containing protein, partial [Candidatus Rokuibacteriota bacterium]